MSSDPSPNLDDSTAVPRYHRMKIILGVGVGVGLVVLLLSIFGALNYIKTALPASNQKLDSPGKPATEPSIHLKSETEPIASGFMQRFAGTALHPLALKMQAHPRVSLAVVFGVVAVLVAVAVTLAVVLSQSPVQDVEDAPVIKSVEDEILKDESSAAVADPIWNEGWFIPVVVIGGLLLISAAVIGGLVYRAKIAKRVPEKPNFETFFSNVFSERFQRYGNVTTLKAEIDRITGELDVEDELNDDKINLKFKKSEERERLIAMVGEIFMEMNPYISFSFLMEAIKIRKGSVEEFSVENFFFNSDAAFTGDAGNGRKSLSEMYRLYFAPLERPPGFADFVNGEYMKEWCQNVFYYYEDEVNPWSFTDLCKILYFWYDGLGSEELTRLNQYSIDGNLHREVQKAKKVLNSQLPTFNTSDEKKRILLQGLTIIPMTISAIASGIVYKLFKKID